MLDNKLQDTSLHDYLRQQEAEAPEIAVKTEVGDSDAESDADMGPQPPSGAPPVGTEVDEDEDGTPTRLLRLLNQWSPASKKHEPDWAAVATRLQFPAWEDSIAWVAGVAFRGGGRAVSQPHIRQPGHASTEDLLVHVVHEPAEVTKCSRQLLRGGEQ